MLTKDEKGWIRSANYPVISIAHAWSSWSYGMYLRRVYARYWDWRRQRAEYGGR